LPYAEARGSAVTVLLSVYIAATVFGVGVTTLDMLGLIGDQDADGDGDADFDGDAHADFDGDTDSDLDGAGDAEADAEADETGSVAGHDVRQKRNPVLRVLQAMRNLVYFSLGFGPTGWFAVATGEPITAALAWSGGVGVVVLGGARLLRRLLRSELSSDVRESDLLMERGEVTVTIVPEQLGRVRIRLGGAYVDRYARSRSNETLSPGTPVRVVDIGEDCVFVEPDEGPVKEY
jgi:membrane protein implicated in regulation of membrane protease activity